MLEHSQNMIMNFFSLLTHTTDRLKNALRDDTNLSCLGLFCRVRQGLRQIHVLYNGLFKYFIESICALVQQKDVRYFFNIVVSMILYQENYLE